jgi:adenylyltransferase/sulfurtransferase
MESRKNDRLDHRYLRFETIQWWDQEKLKAARVLVIGAGALGNEVLKNLTLLGAGHIVVVDMDTIENSNLSRSVLFRESDIGQSKAECAARRMKELNGDICVTPIRTNVISGLGLGYFLWANAIVGALDNREARLFVNSVCARLNKHWIDGGIEVLEGIVRGFHPPEFACYECTMSSADWKLVNTRRSCSILAKTAIAHRGTPTTPTTASVIGGMQAQEVVKMLHGLDTLKGKGFFFEGLSHSSSLVTYQLNPECPWHSKPYDIVRADDLDSDTVLSRFAERAALVMGGFDAFDFARELVKELACVRCGHVKETWMPEESISREQMFCSTCGSETVPAYFHSSEKGNAILEMTPRQIGLPERDIIWARSGESCIGMEIGDEYCFADKTRILS